MSTDATEAIDIVHTLAAVEVAYSTALNLGRGLKAHDVKLEKARARAFVAIVGREPTDEERRQLLWGDA